MNRRKTNNKIYKSELSDGLLKNKRKIKDNYFQTNNKKIKHWGFFVKKQKIEEHTNQTKSISDISIPTQQTTNTYINSNNQNKNENDGNNDELNDIIKTPKKRKNSNKYSDNNENDEDLVTSFERKASELKSPETISKDSFVSSYEIDDKDNNITKENHHKNSETIEDKDKTKSNELIFIEKEKEEMNDTLSTLKKEFNKETNKPINNSDKNPKMDVKKEIVRTKDKPMPNHTNKKESGNLKITVNKAHGGFLQNTEENIQNKPINHKPTIELNKKKKINENIILTNVKEVKTNKYFIHTECKRNKYKKKIINNTKSKDCETEENQQIKNHSNKNNEQMKIDEKQNMKKKIESKNIPEDENKNQINNKLINNPKEKNVSIINIIKNNRTNIEDSNIKELHLNNKEYIMNLSRNNFFHNSSKNIIYAPKKLLSSTMPNNNENNEYYFHKDRSLEVNQNNKSKVKYFPNIMNNYNKNIIFKDNLIRNNPEQVRKKIIELNLNNSHKNLGVSNNNKKLQQKNTKNLNKFIENSYYNINNYSQNSIKPRHSISSLNDDNELQNIGNKNLILGNPYANQNNNYDKIANTNGFKLINDNEFGTDVLIPNNLLNNNLNNSTLEIRNFNNMCLKNSFQTNLNNKNALNKDTSLNAFSINFEDLIILQKNLQQMIISLSKNKPIDNECFEFWNYYYNSSLLNQFEKIFSSQSDSKDIKISIYYSLMSIMLCYDYSFEMELFNKAILSLSDILKLNLKNLLLISEHILNKISKENISNIWVMKLASLVNESIINDYSIQLLKGYNLTLIEKISYNTNIILQNLRYLLKNLKTEKNAILTGMFKKIKEKTYEEINKFFLENILRISNLNGSILGSIFLLKNANYRPVPSPYVHTKNNKKYSLVLDLDETLIHFKPQNNGEDGGILRVRPGITQFLNEVGKYYELIVFTTATQDYADILIDEIEEDKIYFEHRFYREHATIIDNDFVKDLSRIGRPLDSIIIVDNMPQNFRLQKENGIIIKAFWGEDHSDRALFELIPILVNIAKEGEDIRIGLAKYKKDIIKKVTSCFSLKN